MHIARLGLTPVKGMCHAARPNVELSADGPVGDRAFCLVDPHTRRVLRTVDHDRAMACEATWTPPVLGIRTPEGEARGTVRDGAPLTGSYWDRPVELISVPGPWTDLLSRYLDREVVLARITTPGAVIWAGSVSVITTGSLAELARRSGRPAGDGARFRATAVVDTGAAPPFVEDTWVGRRLRLGAAVVRVRGLLDRCAVIDRRPGVGGKDRDFLAALAPDRRDVAGILFGIHGDVVRAGRITVGDPVEPVEAGDPADLWGPFPDIC